MPRARNIKPAFFKNEDLVELPFETRLLFIGLWTLADREGKLEDRPKRIKMEVFPADNVDVDRGLNDLAATGLIVRYRVNDQNLLLIPKFAEHQNPHRNETDSVLPDPTCDQGQKQDAPRTEALGLNPDSLNPESIENNRSSASPPDRFADFWQCYPKKVKKQDARKKWKARKLDARADEIIADVQKRQAKDGRWLEGFVPDPTTYINGSRWEDELEPPRVNGSAKPDWQQIPRGDDELWPWAKKHGYLNPGSMSYYQYRQALQRAVEKRLQGRAA